MESLNFITSVKVPKSINLYNVYHIPKLLKTSHLLQKHHKDESVKFPHASPSPALSFPHAHLQQYLLPCNELHDHRQTHTYRVSSK